VTRGRVDPHLDQLGFAGNRRLVVQQSALPYSHIPEPVEAKLRHPLGNRTLIDGAP